MVVTLSVRLLINSTQLINDNRLKLNDDQKEEIRNKAKNLIIAAKPKMKVMSETRTLYETVKLKEKDVFYIKADKGNRLVIVDKVEYDQWMTKLIEEGPYQKVRGQLTNMEKEAKSALSRYELLFGEKWKRSMKVNCPQVGSLYGLPKIHKPGGGDKMRPINSNIGTPTYLLAKGWTVRNAMDLSKDLKDMKIIDDEVLVSFDIESFFPSVPVPEALEMVEAWLDTQTSLNHMIPEAYFDLTQVCMYQSFFKFRGQV